jgi:hypothetical protein
MSNSQQFAVFSQDENGPVWKGFFEDLEDAKRHARNGAESGELEFFVYSFASRSEVARFFPPRGKLES